MTRESFNIVAGTLALAAAIGALAWASAAGSRSNASGYAVKARYSQVDGLAVGSPVQLAGMRVGTVSALDIDPTTLKPIVTFSIGHGVEIPKDSGALILSDGVFGGKFVRIEPGSETRNLKAGDSIEHVQDAILAEQILEKIIRGAEARRKPDK